MSDPSSITEADCAAEIDRGEIWVWEEDGDVLGFASGDPRDGSIFALFVDPRYHRRGVGRALLPLACQTLRDAGYGVARLSTEAGTRAERFYRADGWAETGRNAKGELMFEKWL